MKRILHRHYSDDLLVAYLDGEISPFRQKSVHKHVQACWQCRARLDELEQQVLAVTKLVEQDQFPGPQRIAEARSKFWIWARSVSENRVSRTGFRFQWFPVRPAWAVSCSLILIGIAWIWLRTREPQLAPLAVMARAEQAESAALHGAVHQRFRVVALQVQPTSRRREDRLDVWYEPNRGRFTSRLSDESGTLRHALWRPAPGRAYVYDRVRSATAVLTVNGSRERVSMDSFLRDGLTPEDLESSLIRWLESRHWKPISLASDFAVMVDDRGTVLGMENSLADEGGWGLRLFARRSRGGVTVEFAMEIDRQTYRPRLQRVRYATAGTVLELQLIPERVQVVAAASFEPDPSLVRPAPLSLPSLPKPSQPTSMAASGLPIVPEPVSLEVQALYALHRVRACLGEPVEVIKNSDGTVLVRGVTGTLERKQQLIAALAQVEGPARLEIDIKSTEEALEDVRQDRVKSTSPAPRAAPSPIQKELEKQFAKMGPQASEAAERFSENAVSLIEDLMGEAWALRHLAERFGSGRYLSPNGNRLLETMCLDHLIELRAKSNRTREFIEPVLAAVSGPNQPSESSVDPAGAETVWDSALMRVFDRTKHLHDRALALFSGAGESVETATIGDVLAGFPELDARLQAAVQEVVALSLSPRTQVTKNKSQVTLQASHGPGCGGATVAPCGPGKRHVGAMPPPTATTKKRRRGF